MLTPTQAQVPNLIIFDKDQSQQFGASNLLTIHNLAYHYLGEIVPVKIWDETKFVNKAAGIGYRALRLGVTGFQLDVNTVLFQHEVFGHGARFREFGFKEIQYTFNHFFPFNFGGTAGSGGKTYPVTSYQGLMILSGGVEGDQILSEQLEERIIAIGKFHYRQSLLFLVSRNNLLRYARKDINNSGDISSYANGLNNLYSHFSQNSTSAKSIFNQALVVLLNPMQLLSILNLGKDYLINGDTKKKEIPFIEFKNIKYIPSMNYNLTPFGGEFIINNYFSKNEKLLLIRVRKGDNTFANFYGGGIKILNLINKSNFKLNASSDFWVQPEYTIGLSNGIKTIDEGLGFMIKSSASYFPWIDKKIGLYGQIGYKTNGYLMGEMLDKGILLRLGLALYIGKEVEEN